MGEISLPTPQGGKRSLALPDPVAWRTATPGQPLARAALAAAHVVADPFADISPFGEVVLDMDATLRFRSHLFSLGFDIAEAMDTAQRGMGLTWIDAQSVIRETLALASHTEHAVVFSGVGTDHLDDGDHSLEAIVAAYAEQLEFVQGLGGRVILMASRALARTAQGPGDYVEVYRQILSMLDKPTILHWLGPMFDPPLAGYWGHEGTDRAMDACLEIIGEHPSRVAGIKVSLLDKDLEIRMRRALPQGVRMYTGDDFNYPDLIAGDGEHASDALLGIFDPIAPAASAALLSLTEGDLADYRRILDPTVELSCEIFRAPTQYYKTGVVFLAYLNGHQDHFVMAGGQQSARSLPHLARVFELAAAAGLLRAPDLAAHRMAHILALHGFEQ